MSLFLCFCFSPLPFLLPSTLDIYPFVRCSTRFTFHVFYSIVLFFLLLTCISCSVLLFLTLSGVLFFSAVFCFAGIFASSVQKRKRLSALCTYIELKLYGAALSLGPGQTALKVYY